MRLSAPIFLGVLTALLLTGCKPLPPSKPSSQWTQQEARGAELFQQKCAKCHEPYSTHRLKGPGLQAITKAGSPPFGSPMDDEQILQLIERGRTAMPATQLPDEQMRDLLAYLHTL